MFNLLKLNIFVFIAYKKYFISSKKQYYLNKKPSNEIYIYINLLQYAKTPFE